MAMSNSRKALFRLEIRTAHVQARECQHDHQESEAAPDGAVDVDFDAALGEVFAVEVGGDGFLLGEDIRDNVVEFAGLGEDRVDRDDRVIVNALQQGQSGGAVVSGLEWVELVGRHPVYAIGDQQPIGAAEGCR